MSRSLPYSSRAVTEIRCDARHNGLTRPLARDDAYLLTLQLRDCPQHELWIDGKSMRTAFLRAGTDCLYDLRADPRVNSISPFHSLHFYLTRAALRAAAYGDDISGIDGAGHKPGVGVYDATLYALGRSLLPVFERPQEAAAPFIDHVTSAVAAYVVHNFGGASPRSREVRGPRE